MGKVWILFTIQVLYLFAISKTSNVTVGQGDTLPLQSRCEPITIPFCMHMMYNQTIFPNLLDHATQEDAGFEVRQFEPLITANCYPDLRDFLCSVYIPVCTISDTPLPPCRHLCELARLNCIKLVNHFGFSWPNELECSQFPVAMDHNACFDARRQWWVKYKNSPQSVHTRTETSMGRFQNYTVYYGLHTTSMWRRFYIKIYEVRSSNSKKLGF